jgi:hypothetical protein
MRIIAINPFRPPMPRTRPELQAASDVANLLLLLDLGRTWDLVDGKGRINKERCEAILARAKQVAIAPRTPGPAQQ